MNTITPQLQLDLNKFNDQYPSINVRTCKLSHDRFLIIDDAEVYHICASLKDLKRSFLFVRFSVTINQ